MLRSIKDRTIFLVGMLGKYLSNLGINHQRVEKKLCGICKVKRTTCSHMGKYPIWKSSGIRNHTMKNFLTLENIHLNIMPSYL